MTRRCIRARGLVVVLALAGATRARGVVPAAVQFDLTSAFNADVIVNYHNGALDTADQPMYNGYALATEQWPAGWGRSGGSRSATARTAPVSK
jgi:hypothetical protein